MQAAISIGKMPTIAYNPMHKHTILAAFYAFVYLFATSFVSARGSLRASHLGGTRPLGKGTISTGSDSRICCADFCKIENITLRFYHKR